MRDWVGEARSWPVRSIRVIGGRASLAAPPRLGDPGGQAGDRGALEDRAHRQLDAAQHLQPERRLDRLERVSARIEEVLLARQGAHAERVREGGRDDRLERGAGRIGDRRLDLERGRQRAPVELAGVRPGQGGQDDQPWHHVGGERAGQVGGDGVEIHRLVAPGRQVGHELAALRLVADDRDRHLADPRALGQARLDLAELHALAAQLDLPVAPAEEVQAALGEEAHQITGAVEAAAGHR
jgi:hypothetical protein